MAEKLIPLEDAQSIVLSHVAPTDLIEIPVWQATGLPLAEDAVLILTSRRLPTAQWTDMPCARRTWRRHLARRR